MHARTQHTLHPAPQAGIAVEVVSPVRARLLRMDEPHLDAALQHTVQYLQERHHVTPSRIDVHVLDISGRNPQTLLRLRHNPADNPFVNFAIEKDGGHCRLFVASGNVSSALRFTRGGVLLIHHVSWQTLNHAPPSFASTHGHGFE